MTTTHDLLNAKQHAALRWIYDNRNATQGIHQSAVIEATSLSEMEYERLALYLHARGLIEVSTVESRPDFSSFLVQPGFVELIHQLDNPPPKDYPKRLETWFRSKPWSIPVFVIFVGLPAAYGYVVMFRDILDWFGIKL